MRYLFEMTCTNMLWCVSHHFSLGIMLYESEFVELQSISSTSAQCTCDGRRTENIVFCKLRFDTPQEYTLVKLFVVVILHYEWSCIDSVLWR